jgi:hypothetical protein
LETIGTWAFFFFWGSGLIRSLLHRKFTLAFNFAFQLYIVGEIFVGTVELTWKTGLWATFECWLALVVSCIFEAILRFRQSTMET